ncbi:hypothetical protein [Blastococcus sp. CT_GayMR16]|uniref:hypothetical protein n=1 Tax=Blastococcus sp. CT_GayMR16 TaxID=2559607 RepID=UPI001073AFB5|nr:hypothetical protein [Blastococcus sp. CT_GayMR16]TFV91421.1 hypothetical protein E4P38_02195 [Blastococcus sp. CT_GayMR16]
MIALLTTARKATAGALATFLAPVTTLFISEQEITARVVVASLLTGAVGGLTVWATGNTRPYGEHAADAD